MTLQSSVYYNGAEYSVSSHGMEAEIEEGPRRGLALGFKKNRVEKKSHYMIKILRNGRDVRLRRASTDARLHPPPGTPSCSEFSFAVRSFARGVEV